MTNPTSSLEPGARELRSPRSEQRRDAGFTLIEIMAVVLIMGLLMSVVGVTVFGRVEEARRVAAKTKIAQLEGALEFYRMDNYKYPPTLEGLVSKPADAKNFPKGGYLKRREALTDPWEAQFIYVSPGAKNPHGVDISSAGPDGQSGNEDDVTNWEDTLTGES
ncbi:MAG: type II secretion system major pseudopilin GspG [bacterium]|nr:type II secretion system major pseudopilin GspG [bacterium]